MAGALRAAGYQAELHEVPDAHNYTAWRDAFDPYLTGLLAGSAREQEVAELWSGAMARGTVVRYGHWGRPVLVFPTERAGRATSRTTAWSARSTACSRRGG